MTHPIIFRAITDRAFAARIAAAGKDSPPIGRRNKRGGGYVLSGPRSTLEENAR